MKKICLNIGCGQDIKKSTKDIKWVNIDGVAGPGVGVDKIIDFNNDRLVNHFEDNSVDVIHIGFPRCASTYFQKYVFPMFKVKKILSDETFIGNFIDIKCNNHSEIKIRGMRSLYGDVKILVMIRDEKSFLDSCYNRYTHYGSLSYKKWFEKIEFKGFDYYIDLLNKSFSNVLIIDINNLSLHAIMSFIGEDINIDDISEKKVNKSFNPLLSTIFRFNNKVNVIIRRYLYGN